MISACVFRCTDPGVILIGDAIQANQRVDEQKLRGVRLESGLWEN